jgi:NAD(P)-dependent dehydrogenase (short-subunit alcohol dehydrogenase family)
MAGRRRDGQNTAAKSWSDRLTQSLGERVMTRTALVTGGNRGIGYEICRRLAAAGHAVILTARDARAGTRAAASLAGDGYAVRAEQLDVSDPASMAECAGRLAADSVDIDVLVNNAAIYTTTALLSVDEAALLETVQINLLGAWRTSRAFVPGMRARGWGRVVNVSTGYAHIAAEPPQAGAYGLSKAGLNVLTRMIAHEAGPAVKVNCMSPGWVATRMGGASAPTTPQEGADTAVWLATLPDDGPTDGFYYERERIPW